MKLKEMVFCMGVLLFLIGTCCIDSNLAGGAILCLLGVIIGFIGEKFLY